MGGKIAQYLACQRPEWLKGLVLIASSPALPMDVPVTQREAMQSAYATRASVEDTLDNVLPATLIKGAVRERAVVRSEEHTSELQSLMRISYAVFRLKKKKKERI